MTEFDPLTPPLHLSKYATEEWMRLAPVAIQAGTLNEYSARSFEMLVEILATERTARELVTTAGMTVARLGLAHPRRGPCGPGHRRGGHVITEQPDGRRLVGSGSSFEDVFGYTWGISGLPADDPRRTYVEFTLEPVAEGTRLTVVESGFAQLPDDLYSGAYGGNVQGWQSELGELVEYLDAGA